MVARSDRPDVTRAAEIGHSTSMLQAILASAVDAILTIDTAGIITSANPATERMFGYSAEELTGRNINVLMPEPYHSAHDGYIANYLRTGVPRIIGFGREVVGRHRDGTHIPIHLAVSEFDLDGTTYFAGIIRDLTAQKEAESQLRQAQKMESMGQLTGGIAHDFNNLLTVIIGNLEMLEGKVSEPLQQDLVREAMEAADLGARLTSRLLAFARRSYLEPEIINLNRFVLGLTDLLHRTLGETVDLSTSLSPELWSVRVDPSQVETAIVNLAVNARDAMPEGGRLVVETFNAAIDEDYVAIEEDLPSGEYVRLSVSDTGEGMPPHVREKAFEPFFTTKETGRGTGLGLSMIYGFARQSGGHATIYSEPGKGTTVNIYLPRHADAGSAEAAQGATAIKAGRGETILAVEDDDRVRRLTMTRLDDLGYTVLAAANGPEALKLLEAHPEIDLVFTDLVMPGGLSGYDLCAKARQMRPGIRCLLTSGYAEELANSDKLLAERLTVLRKPYRQAELAEVIAEVLAAPAS